MNKAKTAQKAIAAATLPLFLCLVSWATSGNFNGEEMAFALASASGILVYVVPNYTEPKRRQSVKDRKL